MLPSLNRAPLGALLAVTLLSFACSPTPGREGVTPMQAHMYAHFDRAGELHRALLGADLAQAKEAAHWIANHEERQEYSGRSVYFHDAKRAFATEVENAPTLREAIFAASRMAQTCGDCHRENEVEPRFLIGAAPQSGSGPEAEMTLHVWAEERMWEGLVGPGDQCWTTGSEAIQSGWLNTQELVTSPDDRPRVRELTKKVYDLAGECLKAQDSEERARLYGEFLNTCVECHQLTEAKITL